LRYTYSFGKFSCIHEFYAIHIAICYVVYWTGILCIATRVVPRTKWLHLFFGRVYVSAMVLATASSLLIHNTGLPAGVLVSFIWVLGGLILGWFIIKVHQNQMLAGALEIVDSWVTEGKLKGRPLAVAVEKAKEQIAMRKTWQQRVISYKAAHGILMVLSWWNIAGRIAFTPINDEFTCYTYPVYKPVNAPYYTTAELGLDLAGKPPGFVPILNPEGEKGPWKKVPGKEVGWAIIMFSFPVLLGVGVGVAYSMWAAPREMASVKNDEDDDVALADVAVGS